MCIFNNVRNGGPSAEKQLGLGRASHGVWKLVGEGEALLFGDKKMPAPNLLLSHSGDNWGEAQRIQKLVRMSRGRNIHPDPLHADSNEPRKRR